MMLNTTALAFLAAKDLKPGEIPEEALTSREKENDELRQNCPKGRGLQQ